MTTHIIGLQRPATVPPTHVALDRVRDWMTSGALAVAEPGATCDAAIEVATRHRVRRLLVIDGVRLVGVVSLRDLGAGGVVAERMRRDLFTIVADASLGEAAAAMAELDVGMLPVIEVSDDDSGLIDFADDMLA
jgi:CBS domain-containing protein